MDPPKPQNANFEGFIEKAHMLEFSLWGANSSTHVER